MPISIHQAKMLNVIERCADLYPEYSRTGQHIGSAEYEFEHVRQGSRVILYAESDGEIVGVIQLLVKTAHPAKLMEEGSGLMQRLRVVPSVRRQGIATRLCQEVEKVAWAHDLKAITLIVQPDNINAQAFYAALGYRREQTFISRASGEEHLAYKKVLVG